MVKGEDSVAFKIEGQVGDPLLRIIGEDEEGTIKVTLISSAIKDLKNVKVLNLKLQYNATSATIGSTLDLSNGSDSFEVIAENGKENLCSNV